MFFYVEFQQQPFSNGLYSTLLYFIFQISLNEFGFVESNSNLKILFIVLTVSFSNLSIEINAKVCQFKQLLLFRGSL